ncbi:potassium-transporting ATPase subunit C [Paenibacillus sp. CFBP13512]|jgi:K+-transporting ATPase ATPase C chain|uniref:potassium-transporting ATPase subunit KdpC n=1 Tax=Paenibacillus TaxID=44249 RepID=UPI0010C10A67|nr:MULTISPECIES: potassium-transporting ATPase subunit KdpC [Paenibacillus]TKJ87708.1 potassium-transporting ATPase subunit C [Paenibacillus sp. CFBP13512]CAJ1315273.1 potassium-transporting ATPase subunit KdpC [Paenibacillus nuruki]
MKTVWVTLRTSIILFLLCCVFYQLAVTGVAQALMSKQADGSLIYNSNNQVVGSELIGQSFTEPQYFQGRISSIDYNANGSGSPNFAPSNPELLKRLQESVGTWQKQNPDVPVSSLPVDLITNSGSGLDPDISPESAKAQIPRISSLTGVSADQLQALVQQNTSSRQLGIFGEPAVNVLKLNLALQKELSAS